LKKTNRNEIEEHLDVISKSEARIMLLYSSKSEAQDIMFVANKKQLTGQNYMWIATQSVV
jgi:ionotropic glutamate receptor NMDA 2B